MDVYVQTLTGAGFEFIVPLRETAGNLKMRIQRTQGIPIWQQHIIFHSRELNNDCNLHANGVRDGDVLKLILAVEVGYRRANQDEPGRVSHAPDGQPLVPDDAALQFAGQQHDLTLLVYRDGDEVEQVDVVHSAYGDTEPLMSVSDLLSPCASVVDESFLSSDEDEERKKNDPAREKENERTRKKVRELMEKMAQRKRIKRQNSKSSDNAGPPAAASHSIGDRVVGSAHIKAESPDLASNSDNTSSEETA